MNSIFVGIEEKSDNYWSFEPMGGDKPIEYINEIISFIINLEFGLNSDITQEQISRELMTELVNNYKYDILNYDFMDGNDDFHFVKIYLLKNFQIKFPMYNFNEIKEIIIELLGDGASSIRGFKGDEKLNPKIFIDKLIENVEDIFKVNYDDEEQLSVNQEKQEDYFLDEIKHKLKNMKEGK